MAHFFGEQTSMNTVQRKIAKGMLAGVVVTMLFPPFCVHPGGSKVYEVGFAFLFSSPKYFDGFVGAINIPLLLTEWLAIGIIWGILVMLTRDDNAPTLIDRTLRVLERNASAKIEAAKLVADAIAEAAETQANATIESAERAHTMHVPQ